MAVAVHIRIGVRGRVAVEVERIFPAETEEDGDDDKDADHDAVSDEFVRDHGLQEEREQGEGQNLREGDQIEFLGILGDLIVVIPGDSLHDHAAHAGDRQQDELHQAEGEQFGKPIDGFGDRQGVVDSGEVGIALAPDQLGGIQSGDDVEEQRRAAFHGLQHQVGDGPDVLSADAAGEVAVIEGQAGHQNHDSPEGHFGEDVGDAQAGQRGELGQGGTRAEDLVDYRQPCRDQTPPRRRGG